ncbi:MAG TPA: 3-oxoacyl-[acyl-carrier-protein] synthase III C-terminal domain-containing protein [Gemmataceae bacterium]|jgi:3-oxoacyl-[acyl-carrier-protein] synthase-3|nr:3-oxoacyl-[acyl-carrier-protein] synthase III C-terminal domain-containing protein [Gemmataceae bacterium]
MIHTREHLTAYVLNRLRLVQQESGQEGADPTDPDARLADVIDSMGMVELLAVLADDCGVKPEAIEECVHRSFGTIAELAAALQAAGLAPRPSSADSMPAQAARQTTTALAGGHTEDGPARTAWLAATAVRLPDAVQTAAAINAAIHRPAGWLECRAGIQQRRVWGEQDPLAAAAEAGRDCVGQAGLAIEDIGLLLVTSEAPPLLAGLAAALHARLDLPPGAVSLEVGGACTGFVAALWLAQALQPHTGAVLIVSVEAPTRHMQLRPGPAGEAAALFGDAAAAAVLCEEASNRGAVPLLGVALGADGRAGGLLQVRPAEIAGVEVFMDGGALAGRAVHAMAQAVRDLARDHGRTVAGLAAVVAHGGNGRMPALLARKLGLPAERVWSETGRTGNLGSASLPVAWAAHQPGPDGPMAWTAVGAGLTWAAALTGGR